jgi:hypothetical protein
MVLKLMLTETSQFSQLMASITTPDELDTIAHFMVSVYEIKGGGFLLLDSLISHELNNTGIWIFKHHDVQIILKSDFTNCGSFSFSFFRLD